MERQKCGDRVKKRVHVASVFLYLRWLKRVGEAEGEDPISLPQFNSIQSLSSLFVLCFSLYAWTSLFYMRLVFPVLFIQRAVLNARALKNPSKIDVRKQGVHIQQ